MADFDVAVFAGEAAGHVEEAAHVAGEQEVRVGGFDVGGFVSCHTGGNIREFDAKCAAEAAADFGLGHFGEGEAGDCGEQSAGLGFDAEFAQAGAGIVVGGGAVIGGRGGREF